jgi:CDP-6-deoxy-D-xylo-4-hexulose-3-dehydrase
MQLKQQILSLVKEYYAETHNIPEEFIPRKSYVKYGGHFYDESKIVNLVGSALDFWLTADPWATKFKRHFANKSEVRYCSFVNSDFIINNTFWMGVYSGMTEW